MVPVTCDAVPTSAAGAIGSAIGTGGCPRLDGEDDRSLPVRNNERGHLIEYPCALRPSADRGAFAVTLNSAPARVAANALYRKLGFELRDTNSYVWRP